MAKYVPRLTAPSTDNFYYYEGNVFEWSGYGLPNCTAYAWGRMYELTDSYPSLCTGNAENWYYYDDEYERGLEPKLGAIIVWAKGEIGYEDDGAGHVAVVEQINADGSFVVSGSGWGSTTVFWLEDVPASCYRSGYRFLGFIYCPINFDNGSSGSDTVSKSDVSAGNYYLSESEMQINARYIMQELKKKGWTLNAIAGMIGNFESESTINPAIWESLDTGDTEQGYGLVQWTPASKYLDWCSERGLDPADMDSALLRIEYELQNGLQYYETDSYPLSFSEFKTSTESAYYLGMAFVTNYERPAEINTARGTNAEKWYNYLSDFWDSTGDTPTQPEWQPSGKKMPLWLLISATKRK